MNNISAVEALRAEVTDLAAEHAPRLFALCWIDAEADNGGILGWGLEVDEGHVVVCGDSGSRILGHCSSADQARRLFGRSRSVEVVWLDGRDGAAIPVRVARAT
ncbi:hypothetical protein [Actinomadura latina]|uniref:Uncharacterized protein n=1 Tax=Actinomadura latina TaxID=163603 RepID=A0A846Z0Q5_9ACTN|nr:hypothetical protein [Actinomadura latina]NKZ06840.1 hypothetical protein [Actinomadura latina]